MVLGTKGHKQRAKQRPLRQIKWPLCLFRNKPLRLGLSKIDCHRGQVPLHERQWNFIRYHLHRLLAAKLKRRPQRLMPGNRRSEGMLHCGSVKRPRQTHG